jgi:hypothetical protein
MAPWKKPPTDNRVVWKPDGCKYRYKLTVSGDFFLIQAIDLNNNIIAKVDQSMNIIQIRARYHP